EDAIIKGTLTNTKSTNGAPLLGPGGWTERWADCTATIPPGFTRGTSSACIAFHVSTGSGDTTKVWAHLPPITVGSTFGGVVGINEHKQTAEADPLADITIDDYTLPNGTKARAAGSLYRDANGATVDGAWLDDPANRVLDATGKLNNVLIYTTGPIELTRPRQGQATFVSTKR